MIEETVEGERLPTYTRQGKAVGEGGKAGVTKCSKCSTQNESSPSAAQTKFMDACVRVVARDGVPRTVLLSPPDRGFCGRVVGNPRGVGVKPRDGAEFPEASGFSGQAA